MVAVLGATACDKPGDPPPVTPSTSAPLPSASAPSPSSSAEPIDDSVPRFERPPGIAGISQKIALSPDAKTLAVEDGGSVRVWDLEKRAARFDAEGGANGIGDIAFSADGARLAVVGHGQVGVFDVASGKRLASMAAPEGEVIEGVAWSRDGRELLGAFSNGPIVAWNAASGAVARTVVPKARRLYRAAYRIDGEVITMALALEKSITLVGAGGADGRRIAVDDETPLALAFRPDGAQIALLQNGSTKIGLWDARTGAPAGKLATSSRRLETFAFAPDGKALVAGSHEGWADVLAVPSGKQIRRLAWHPASVAGVAWSADGKTIATTGSGGAVLWDAESGAIRQIVPRAMERPTSVACSPDGAWIVARDADVPHQLWSLRDGTMRLIPPRGTNDLALGFRKGGKEIVAVGWTGSVARWSADKLELLGTTQLEGWSDEDTYGYLVLDAAGTLAAGVRGWDYRVWDLETGKAKRVKPSAQGPSVRVALSPDGHLLSVASGTAVDLFDVESGAHRASLAVAAVESDPLFGKSLTMHWLGADTLVIQQRGSRAIVETWDVKAAALRSSRAGGSSRTVSWSPDGRFSVDDHGRLARADGSPLGPPPPLAALGLAEGALRDNACWGPGARWMAMALGGGILIAPTGEGAPLALHAISAGASFHPLVVAADGRFDASPDLAGELRFRHRGKRVSAAEVGSFRKTGLLQTVVGSSP